MFTKIFSFIQNTVREESGQLLVEVLVAMVVGGGLLVAASAAIVSVVRQNYENRSSQTASSFGYDLINKVKEFAASNWHNVFDLAHGSSNPYFIASGATSSVAVAGQEGMLSNDIASGLIGHWNFDETGGNIAYDTSGNLNNGTLVNGPIRQTGVNCQVGGCLSFNGSNNYVSASIFPQVTRSGTYTFSAWVNTANTSSQTIFQNAASASDRNGMMINGANIIFGYYNGTTWVSLYGPISTNSWNYVVGVDNGGTLSLYINGVLYTNTTASLYVNVDASYFYLGKETYLGGQNYLNGSLDDVRVYNRALSANEIQQLYSSSVYSRYFYVDNVNRTYCGIGDITSNSATGCTNTATAGAGDINNDPSTQKITSVITRQDGGNYQFYDYVSRGRSALATQNDWSGGSGYDGPFTAFNNQYSTSTNISAGKTLALSSVSTNGTLYSSIFDTQITNGAAFNSLTWNGTANNGSSVKFQIATSNSTSSSGGSPTGPIDSVYRYAWNDYIGWLDFGYTAGAVSVSSTQMTGYAYNTNVGEISLDCTTSPNGNICATSNYQVARDASGNLSGWAWNDEIGWISFCGGQSTTNCPGTISYKVNVNPSTGMFTGYAWNDVVGWISFNCADVGLCGISNYKVSVVLSSGWNYVGPDGTNLTYYNPAVGTSMAINPAYHNNNRYFRYKIILSPDSGLTTSPTVADVDLNWSP